MQVHVGSFAQPGSTGNQATTGVGFTPQIVIFTVSTTRTSDGGEGGINVAKGAGVSSSNRFYMAVAMADNDTGNTPGLRHTLGKCIGYISSGGTILAEADFVSQDSDGFTINWSTVDATARVINYIAIAGITSAQVGNFQVPAGTGNAAVTGVGFQPDCLLFFSNGNVTAPPVSTNGNLLPSISFINGSATGSLSNGMQEGSTAHAHAAQKAKSLTVTNASGTIVTEATLVSLDSDGFTQNYTTVTNRGQVYYIALQGTQNAVGTLSQPGSTGNQSVSGLSFTPKVVLLFSGQFASSTSVQADAHIAWGAGQSSSARFAVTNGAIDTAGSTNASTNLDRTKLINMMTAAHGSPVTLAAADLVSLDSAGFTINWTTADATAREIYYLALGQVVAGVTYPQLERGIRGLNRGLYTGAQ